MGLLVLTFTVFDSQRSPLSVLRSLLSQVPEGMYHLEVHSGGQVVGSPTAGLPDSCSFKVSSKDGEKCAWSEGVLVLLTSKL